MGIVASVSSAVASCGAAVIGGCAVVVCSKLLKCCCMPFAVPFGVSSFSHGLFMALAPLLYYGIISLPPSVLIRKPFGLAVCQNTDSSGTITNDLSCYRNEVWTRVFFALIVLYLLIWIGTLLGNKICRAVQTSYPLPKFFFFILLFLVALFLPSSLMGLIGYSSSWSPIVVLPIYMVYTIDFGYLVNETLVKFYMNSGKRVYVLLTLAIATILLLLSISLYIVAFVFIGFLSFVTAGPFAGVSAVVILVSISNIAEHGAFFTSSVSHAVASGHFLMGLYFFTQTVEKQSLPSILYFGIWCALLGVTLLYSIGRFGHYVDIFHSGEQSNEKATDDVLESVHVPSPSTVEETSTSGADLHTSTRAFTEKQASCSRFQAITYTFSAIYMLALGLYFEVIPYRGLNHLFAFSLSHVIGSSIMIAFYFYSLLAPRIFSDRSF